MTVTYNHEVKSSLVNCRDEGNMYASAKEEEHLQASSCFKYNYIE